MWSLVSTVGGQQESEEEKIKRLEALVEDNDEKEDESEKLGLKDEDKKEIQATNCFAQTGFVTKVEGNYIVIDTTLHVDKKVLQACPFQHQLEVGVKVSYLAYKAPDSESIKVIKLEALLNEVWGEKQKEKAQEEENKELVHEISPTYFNYNQRSEQGTVIAKRRGLLTVETDQGEHSIEMDNVKLTYVLEVGDYVVLDCLVQIDETYFDTRGNILEVRGIAPTPLDSDTLHRRFEFRPHRCPLWLRIHFPELPE